MPMQQGQICMRSDLQGSSNLLAEQFVQGATEAGHSVQVIDAAHAVKVFNVQERLIA